MSSDALTALRKRVTRRVEAALLASADLGFLGAMPIPDQIDHALGFVHSAETLLLRPPDSVVDLGTGGGIPGLVLLDCWPSSRIVLLDSSERRTEFLRERTTVWDRPGLVEVVRGRAEEIGREDRWREQFELVTARSFGAPAVTAECAAPLLAVNGVLVVSEPPGGDGEIRWPDAGIGVVGLSTSSTVRFDDRFGYRVLLKSEPTDERYPRRVGIPSKRPLF
jgi:16S rRNA (guanine527-N7)-methyltransferase